MQPDQPCGTMHSSLKYVITGSDKAVGMFANITGTTAFQQPVSQ
jgi:hypothetical protein